MLDGNPDAAVIQGDLREPAKILADPGTQLLLDFTQPVAVFLVAVLHFIADSGQPADIVATLRDALAPAATSSSATLAVTSSPAWPRRSRRSTTAASPPT